MLKLLTTVNYSQDRLSAALLGRILSLGWSAPVVTVARNSSLSPRALYYPKTRPTLVQAFCTFTDRRAPVGPEGNAFSTDRGRRAS